MIIYRVEHISDHTGPYNGTGSIYMDHSDSNHPSMRQEFYAIYTSIDSAEWFFGFTSAEALSLWFEEYIQELHDAGNVIGMYECDTVIEGELQCVFKMHHATRIDEISILAA